MIFLFSAAATAIYAIRLKIIMKHKTYHVDLLKGNTMPLHTITKVTQLVPEAGALVKRASLESNLPTTSRNETLLSALEIEYMTKVANTRVDLDDVERVCRAVDLYNLQDEIREHTSTMIKSASMVLNHQHEIKQQVEKAENFIDTQLMSMNPDMEKVAAASEELWDSYRSDVTNDKVRLYAGAGTLVKEAAVRALKHRAKRTGNMEFEKVAEVILSTNTETLSTEDNRAIISAISSLEKAASYVESNLYTDMFIAKQASVMVNLGSRRVNADSLVAAAEVAGSILGSDIGELLKDAHQNVAAIEALPMGELQVIDGVI